MRLRQFLYLVRSDLYRCHGRTGLGLLLRDFILNPGFRFTFLLRTCAFLYSRKVLRYSLFPIALFFHLHYKTAFGLDISFRTEIGSGLFIGHIGGIVVNPSAVIGRNCNLSHGVTIGQTNRGERKGWPPIGDNVLIAPGACVIGKIVIGNNAAIGANCVVTQDVPENAVVTGIPGQVISYCGSVGYIDNTDY